MLRIAAVADEVPPDILNSINELHQHVGRHLRRVCSSANITGAELTMISALRPVHHSLQREGDSETHCFGYPFVNSDYILQLHHSKSTLTSCQLPDFVFALEKYEADQKRAPSRSPKITPHSPPLKPRTPEPSSSRSSPVPSKLRYTAYDPPKPTSPLRRMSSSSSRHSDDGGSRAHSYQDPMSMTVTPGDLTIVAQTSDLRSIPSVSWLVLLQYSSAEPPLELASADRLVAITHRADSG